MANLEKQLRDLLYNNWSLLEPYAKDTNIIFNYGYMREEQIPSKKMVIQIGHLRESQNLLHSGGSLEGEALLTAKILVRAKQDKVSDIESAKDKKFTIKDEIERILLEATLPSDWVHAFIQNSENTDLPDYEPPIISELMSILVKYIRT